MHGYPRHVAEATLDGQLRFAIAHKRLIRFSYLGAMRVAEPHDYGIQHGEVKLLVYQLLALEHGAPRDRAEGWRLLYVAKMTGCAVLDEGFPGSRGHRHEDHHAWDVVYARVG